VPLVRQLAQDLAQREAEMTRLRRRAEARERELKRMLREVEVANIDIEKGLNKVDEEGDLSQIPGGKGEHTGKRNSTLSVGDLVGEALGDDLSNQDDMDFLAQETDGDKQATIRATVARNADTASLASIVDTGEMKGTVPGWKSFLAGGAGTVKKSQNSDDEGLTAVLAPTRRKGIDETMFQPLERGMSRTTSRSSRTASEAKDDQAVRRTSRNSWTMKLFAGKTTTSKDTESQTIERSRSSTVTSSMTKRTSSQASHDTTDTAVSAMSKLRSSGQGARKSLQAITIPTKSSSQSVHSMPMGSPGAFDPDQNLGPVEMDAILPHGSRPPTLSPSNENPDNDSDLLTDRFGFIYDQRRRKKEAEALARIKSQTNQTPQEKRGNDLDSHGGTRSRSSTLASADEPDEQADPGSTKRRQDHHQKSSTPSKIPSQTPSHAPQAIEGPSKRPGPTTMRSIPTFGDRNDGLSLPSPAPAPSASSVTSSKAEIAKPAISGPGSPSLPTTQATTSDTEPVKILLAQLTDLHDKLQREKNVKWNEFMRKVRAERNQKGETSTPQEGRSKIASLPETSIADGEIIGIATLGNKGKVGRAKYREFKSLVLAGIPVLHRAKIWAECSGAAALRVPGYYHETVETDTCADQSVLSQIQADINRTLTDNVFFRTGPGVRKLNEVLLAYAQRNPEVGYCQGMNMIAASLLLMMPTAEDAFWVLASLVENILPQHYFDNSLLASRADQQVLRSYVTELLPKLSAHLEDLSVELEALTFQWFLSLFTDCLSAEALYRVWDVLLCCKDEDGNGGSTFLFQVALALLKLNENQLLACESPGEVYAYLGGEITNHAISIDGLIRASEGLKTFVKRKDVEERRRKWVKIEEQTIREREKIRNGMGHKRAGSEVTAAA